MAGDVRNVPEAAIDIARRVVENHHAIAATGTGEGQPLNVQHWILLDQLAEALGIPPRHADPQAAIEGLEQIMLVRLGHANRVVDAARDLVVFFKRLNNKYGVGIDWTEWQDCRDAAHTTEAALSALDEWQAKRD